MTAPADRLVALLEGVKPRGASRWVAKCPAHKDRTASLAIRELDDGRLLLHCFASCRVDDVLSAIGLSASDLFPPRQGSPGSGQTHERAPFSARDLLAALNRELGVVWVLLTDIAEGRTIGPNERKRAGVARERCVALIQELQHVR